MRKTQMDACARASLSLLPLTLSAISTAVTAATSVAATLPAIGV